MVQSSSLNLLKNALAKKSSNGINSLFKLTLPNPKTRNILLRVDHHGPPSKLTYQFSTNASALFNELPDTMKCPTYNVKKFKRELKKINPTMNRLPKH